MWSALVWWLALCYGSEGFNLETRLPIIKMGKRGAYFGYSVAQHQSIDELHNGVENNWLLVGAPIDENLQPGTNKSGALHRCPITTKLNDCVQVITDGRRTIDSDKLMQPLKDEVKDNQWLGVTVRSQGAGGTVMVCAHRYARKGQDYVWGYGLCYTLNQRLDYADTWEPCKGRPVDRGHEQFGFCQAGTSGIILDDDAMIIGSPGTYTWRGTAFNANVSTDFLSREKTIYVVPFQDQDAPVDKYSMLGMSVTGGRFFGKHMTYVAGAPRSNGTGQVILFSKDGINVNMKVEHILNGEQFASSFGYEVIAADLNGDKLPDLIVGAPFYFDREAGGAVYIFMNSYEKCRLECNPPIRLTGKPESRFGFALANVSDLNNDGFDDLAVGAPYEGRGAIYIYLGSKNGIITEPAQIIRAEELPENSVTTLGYSLSGGMDLDENGYPDLLAGAYESDSVVLLRSRPIIGIRTSVQPERNLMNIDPNGQGCDRDREYKHTCFSFQTCCTIEAVKNNQRYEGSGGTVRVKYRIEAETFPGNNRKFSRVWFGPDNSTRPSFIEKNIQPAMSSSGSLNDCQEHIVYVKENTPDIQSAIKFKLSYSLIQSIPKKTTPGDPVPSLNEYPILNQQEAAKIFSATFQKDCGENDICESDLNVEAKFPLLNSSGPNTWELMLGKHQELSLNVSVTNKQESAYETQLFVSHPASISYIGRKIEGNKQLSCNPFNATLVVCAIGNPFNSKDGTVNISLRFDPKSLDDTQSLLEFVVFANSTSKEVDYKKPLRLITAVVRKAELQISGSARPEQVFYAGDVRGESAMRYRDDIGSRILHTYQVFNKGPWRVGTVDIHFDWPFQVANNKPQGKWLLYLEDVPTVESQGGGSCSMLPGQVNPLRLQLNPGVQETPLDELAPQGILTNTTQDSLIKSRRKREQEMIVRPEAYTDKEGRKHQVVFMDCLLGTAKCFKFVCHIHNLLVSQAATVRIRARLWNATLVEDYPRVSYVSIQSRAKIHIPPSLAIQQDTKDDEALAETVAYPELLDQQEAEPVPIWIIVVAVVAGLVLLILLTYVLWKFGFFKRRRPDPTLSGNIEKHRNDNSDLDY